MHKGEKFNTITHLIGAVAALSGMVILVVLASQKGDPWKIVSFTVYGVTLFTLYIVSTLYHGLQGRVKRIFKQFDYFAIYLLIAGTYTPFTLVSLNGYWGWILFGAVWTLALIGIVQEYIMRKKRTVMSMTIYIVMGWLIIIALVPLKEALSMAGLYWLLIGGLFYTFGIVFYVFDERVHYFHGIWHIFVLLGSASHYFSILYYVL